MEKEKHSEEVAEFRRELVDKIKEMDFNKFSAEDATFLLCLVMNCTTHLGATIGGGED